MKEPLDINFSSTFSYTIYPSDELQKHGEELLSIVELSEKLQYYNKYICSLSYSYPPEGLGSHGKYDQGRSQGAIFLKKNSSENDDNFEMYLQERQKEVDRLKGLVVEYDNYSDKLKCFMEEKAGQIRFDELKIESNEWVRFLANGAGEVPKDLLGDQTEIDLYPRDPEEIKSYNQYIRKHVEQAIYNKEKPHWLVEENYKGFRALPAMGAIREQIKRALNKETTIKSELNRIENKYKYPYFTTYIEFLYPYSVDDLGHWQAALFNALANGYQYDYSKKKLSIHEMTALIHVEQVFIYYKYMRQFLKDVVYGSFEELFHDEVENGVFSELKNKKTLLVDKALYSFLFNTWLQEKRDWEYGDQCEYQMHLTKNQFKEFLKEHKAKEQTQHFLYVQGREEAYKYFIENSEAIRKCFRIKRKATIEDCKQIPGLKEGDIIEQDPPFSTNTEAFALLTNYYAPIYMELEKNLFIEKYKTWNEATMQAEISEIEAFISAAKNQNLSEACRVFSKWGQDTDAYIFLRLTSGFYENLEVQNYPSIGAMGNKESHIYGKYVLFYNFLKTQLNVLKLSSAKAPGAKSTEPNIKDTKKANTAYNTKSTRKTAKRTRARKVEGDSSAKTELISDIAIDSGNLSDRDLRNEKVVFNTRPESWQDLQNFVGQLFTEIGFEVEISKIIELVRGEKEIDVYVVDKSSEYHQVILIECKQWNHSVHQEVVHAFRTIMNDFGANVGFIVSKRGFQEGCYKAIKNTNIRLVTLEELEEKYYSKWQAGMIKKSISICKVLTPYWGAPPRQTSANSKDSNFNILQLLDKAYIPFKEIESRSFSPKGMPLYNYPIKLPVLNDQFDVSGEVIIRNDRDLFDFIKSNIVMALRHYHIFYENINAK